MTSGGVIIWIYDHTDDEDFKSKDTLIDAISGADTTGKIKEWIEQEGYNAQGQRFYQSEIQKSIDDYNKKIITKQVDEATTKKELDDIDLSAISSGAKDEMQGIIAAKEKKLSAEVVAVVEDEKTDAIRRFTDAISKATTQEELDNAIPAFGTIRSEYGSDVKIAVSDAWNRKASELETLSERAFRITSSQISDATTAGRLDSIADELEEIPNLTSSFRSQLKGQIEEKRETL